MVQIKTRAKSLVLLAGATVLTMCLGGTVAYAEDSQPDVTSTEGTLAAVAPEVLNGVAEVSVSDQAVEHVYEDVEVQVPLDPNEDISIASDAGEFEISLPFSEQATSVETDSDGVIAYDNGNDSSTVAVIHDDGSLQINTIIENSDSPSSYDYEVSLPVGGAMTVGEDGTVAVTDAAGALVGGAAPAWAKDAQGNSVPTWYEANGSTLTQHVDLSAVSAYPVVADPWWGVRLFGTIKRDIYKGDYRYSGWVTGWGAVILSGGGGIGGWAAGGAVFRGAGWDEWKKAWPAVTNKATLKQQYDCHVAAGVYGLPFTQDYNIERFRANRASWVPNIWNHRCNW